MNHLSLHCFPILFGKNDEINDQFSAPYFSTKFIKDLSSFSDQGDFIKILFFFSIFLLFFFEIEFFLLLFFNNFFDFDVLFLFLGKF